MGIRCCGKSTLLKQYQEHLKGSGVTDEQIVSINFEELEYEHLLNYKALLKHLKLCRVIENIVPHKLLGRKKK